MRYLLTATLLLVLLQPASAAVTYDLFYRPTGTVGIVDEVFVAADTVFAGAEIVLRETRTSGEESALGSGGLRGFAINLFSDPNGGFRNAVRNANFDLTGTGADADTLTAFNFIGGTVGSPVTEPNVVGDELVLGTLDLLAPATAGQSTLFTIEDFDPNNANFLLASGAELDGAINFNNSLTVTAIPEPTGVAVLGLFGAAVLIRRRSR